ncbi:MAG TPA: hypothetical protein VGR95_07560 [Thermoanaerobaculia bacterium]|jgi:hypothetical protein|nr:hypothetical protein [Thermoanaerobaculia bacterium]
MARRVTLFVMLVLATAASASEELAGLWSAKKRFGPDAHGTLIVLRSGGRYTADLSGQRVAVTATKSVLAFSLPDRGGDFRGKLDRRGVISGHWFRYGTAVNGADKAARSARRWSF